jgi:CheY-like chemotaxis protein
MHAEKGTLKTVDVLIAEDDALVRDSLRRLLEGQGYTTAAAADGREALDLARAHRPRCVFVDLGMPVLDGFAVARELRLDPRTRGAHIHCLTGRTDTDAREQALRAGCEEYLTKPVDVGQLLEVVHQGVGRAEAGWVTGLGVAEAEELLDWLENQGCTGLELEWRQEAGFAVRCACPPGLRLGRDETGRVALLPVG